MKTKVLAVLGTGCLVALVAWLAYEPGPAQPQGSGEIPGHHHRGLEFLVKSQLQDGRWEGDGGQHPVAMTGLVGLALLMERDSSRTSGAPECRGATRNTWTTSARPPIGSSRKPAGRDGLIFSEHPSETDRYITEGHRLATLFLAGVCRRRG